MYSKSNKSIYIFGSLFILLLVASCDQFKKPKNTEDQFDKTGKKYSLVAETTSVFWTGYKTTEKTPVKGQFMKINIDDPKKADTAKEALDGVNFSIPVSSLFSNDESRDTKLKGLFFGVMDQTELLSGSIHLENDTLANVSLHMNGLTKTIPLTYFISGQMLSMQGSMNVEDWNTQKALASLHVACKEQHTGADGISKTWGEVGINVESYLKVE